MSWLIYLHYDEESLALHSNAGLIRRAKKALDQVQYLATETAESNPQQLRFLVEDGQVKLNPQGIAAAECSCPAQGCCKHILSSILWMQQHPEQFNGNTALSTAETAAATAEDNTASIAAPQETTIDPAQAQQHCLSAALALDHALIIKKSSKATRRLAYQFYLAWQQQPEHCQIELQADKISFLTELSTSKVQLFPALGLDGMLSDIASKQQAAAHLACLACLFERYAANTWSWPDELVHADQEQAPVNKLEAEDLALIEELQQICRHFIRQGLSHIAYESVLALHILNMQARAQNLPRLAAELRQLHGMMRQFLNDDDIQIDEHQIFDQLAHFYSYLAALTVSQAHPERLALLKGGKQRDYQQQHIAHLIPLGCEWWQLDSGARGLTLCYWDVEQQQQVEVTQARANHLDTTFDKNSAAQKGIWGSNIDYLLQHQIELTQAKMTDNHRISASAETRFVEKAEFKQLTVQSLDQYPLAISDWRELDALIHPKSSLAPNPQRYVLLRHQQINQPELNEMDQCFECRVEDQHGLSVQLSMPVDAHHEQRLKHFSRLIFNAKPVATLVRIDLSQQHVRLIPCSVMLQKKEGLSIFSLDYHYPPQPPKANVFELITGRIEKMLKQKKQWLSTPNYSPLQLLIQHSQALLVFYANIGRAQLDPLDQDKLAEYSQQFDDLGLSLVAQQLHKASNSQDLAHQLLQSRHLLKLVQRLQYRFELESQTMSS